jgi:Fe-S cluster biogenesis protein NfuA|tara:strand:+ start:423 stop:776 length:354 start_codon:yes stop_codon:yes gene_type:complete
MGKVMDNKEQYDRIVTNIKQTLENYVAPAVAGHGGVVNFVDFQEGTLTLEMSGACSGCAMSAMTLQQGIEGIMISMVPEVKTIVGVDDPNSSVDPFMRHNYDYNPDDYWDDDVIAKD